MGKFPKPDLEDYLFLLGLILILIGLWQIYPPLALITLGLALIGFSTLLGL